jgi:hypothetical protein
MYESLSRVFVIFIPRNRTMSKDSAVIATRESGLKRVRSPFPKSLIR